MNKALGIIATLAVLVPSGAIARPPIRPAVPVIIEAGDTDPCSNGVVKGLRANGDGFLSIRSTPSASARELGRLYNGQTIYVCAGRGDWLGIVYGRAGQDCNVTTSWVRTLPYTGPCNSGWVHRRWVEIYAG